MDQILDLVATLDRCCGVCFVWMFSPDFFLVERRAFTPRLIYFLCCCLQFFVVVFLLGVLVFLQYRNRDLI